MLRLNSEALVVVRDRLNDYLRNELGLPDCVIKNLYARPMVIAIRTYVEFMEERSKE
jgi:hypothetical protein